MQDQPLNVNLDYFQMRHIQGAGLGIGKIVLADSAKNFHAFANGVKDKTKPRVQSRYRIGKLVISIKLLQ